MMANDRFLFYLVILDSSGEDCQLVNFRLGTSSGTIRSWEIKVTQYKCDNVDLSGPPGCLQYYTSTSGIIQSFNFPSPAVTTIGNTVTHLSNQNYEICIRRDINACFICYYATIDVAASSADSQHSFGLSAIPAVRYNAYFEFSRQTFLLGPHCHVDSHCQKRYGNYLSYPIQYCT